MAKTKQQEDDTVMVEVDDNEETQEAVAEDIVIVEDQPPEQEVIEEESEEVVEESAEDEPIVEEDEPITAEEEIDVEREAIRERRRKEKQERKARRETAIKRDKTELDFLRSRNDDLERRLTAQERKSQQVELSTYDTAIAQANKEVQMADRVIAKAVETNNGEDVTKAMKYRDQAMQKAQQLSIAKQQASQPQTEAPPVDDRTMYHAQKFMEENPWYDSQGRDEDSAIVMAIDQALSKDGYNPQTEEYWDELTLRAARRLPERFEEEDIPAKKSTRKTTRKARGGPAVGSGKEHAPTSTRKEIYISPERKQALMDAGVWDDPVLRTKYVKRYAQYDKENQ
tara:strand:+ start:7295 stop:8317 length:1023 start_codon:yes stop_codon:yes gene_type:complete